MFFFFLKKNYFCFFLLKTFLFSFNLKRKESKNLLKPNPPAFGRGINSIDKPKKKKNFGLDILGWPFIIEFEKRNKNNGKILIQKNRTLSSPQQQHW